MSYQNPGTFAPYTPPPDETPKSQRSSVRYAPVPHSSSAAASTSASVQSSNPFAGVYQTTHGLPEGTIKVNKYETTLGLRVDVEAACTYLLGCVTGVLFLIMETKNDYVRFHAWQSSLLFAAVFVSSVVVFAADHSS
ncbi:9146_t:CDS:2 [Paraglomus brasilianum]|uniref:9146_t:CDS:1 n=1 Tax=Paraglomus brasilianum TaxID=144538 RepID=A0A9N9F3Z6_9GLOM|nr:9146_t:CDS:2 [Paraglomus brasilianum]